MAFNLGGAASGAASGASMGSMAGPWGTAIGGVAGGVMGAFSGGGEGQQYMAPQWLQNPEDAGAADFRNYNRDYTQGMMQDIQSGVDPMQNRADAQYGMEIDAIRRENLGVAGDRGNSLWGQAMQQMSQYGLNPKQMLAQKKKMMLGMQGQFDDTRSRIYGGGTDYMRNASLQLPRIGNQLREGAQGQWSAGMMGGMPQGSQPDMEGTMAGLKQFGGALGTLANRASKPSVSPAGYAHNPNPGAGQATGGFSTPSNYRGTVTYPGAGQGPYQPKV